MGRKKVPPSALAKALAKLPIDDAKKLLAVAARTARARSKTIVALGSSHLARVSRWVDAQDAVTLALCALACVFTYLAASYVSAALVPKVDVALTDEERRGGYDAPGGKSQKWKRGAPFPKDRIPCYDPGTMEMLGPDMPAMSAADVKAAIAKARIAQKQWATSSFAKRRSLLRVIQRFVLENQDEICEVSGAFYTLVPIRPRSRGERRSLRTFAGASLRPGSLAFNPDTPRRLSTPLLTPLNSTPTIACMERPSARDSGKPLVDAAFGEILTTMEKIKWLLKEGERWLRPEKRGAGLMMFYKSARVEYRPVGVMGAIVPWNYPFHNVFNPLLANVFAGNALVVKVSEHASWSSKYYGRAIKACLAAVGAPTDLVQIVHGYAEAGGAVVTGGCDKVVFVGSTGVGRAVMRAAAETLTPVVLELGGKDPFIVLQDADLSQCVPMALRGAFQSCGQNCAGAERFYVHAKKYDEFVKRVVAAASKCRQGWALAPNVDCGAMCMPNQAAYVQSLVDDAVAKGATAAVGGAMDADAAGQARPISHWSPYDRVGVVNADP